MAGEPEPLSYVEDHGAGIPEIGDKPPAGVEPTGPGAELEVRAADPEAWLEESVREHLTLMGSGLHMLFGGETETAFEMSKKDLQRIAPPLTRILNRHESLAAWGVISDPLLLAEGSVLYAGRSVLQVRAAKQKREEAELEEMYGPQHVEPPPAAANGNVTPMRVRARPSSRAERILQEHEQIDHETDEEEGQE